MVIITKLRQLSFRTGIIVLFLCVPFYIASFAQMLLPLSTATKSVLWLALFGLAKTFQYVGGFIIGVEGFKRLRQYFQRKRGEKI